MRYNARRPKPQQQCLHAETGSSLQYHSAISKADSLVSQGIDKQENALQVMEDMELAFGALCREVSGWKVFTVQPSPAEDMLAWTSLGISDPEQDTSWWCTMLAAQCSCPENIIDR